MNGDEIIAASIEVEKAMKVREKSGSIG